MTTKTDWHAFLDGKRKPTSGTENSETKTNAEKDNSTATEEDVGTAKPSAATIMVNLAKRNGTEFWHTPNRELYITINNGSHKENYPIRSKAVKLWLGSLHYNQKHKAPGAGAIEDATTILESIALYEGAEHEIYVRVGPFEGKIYIDMGDKAWRAIEVTANGWEIIAEPPIRFFRPWNMLPLPTPAKGGNWDDLRKLANVVGDINWILSIAWLVQGFWPAGPYAFLDLGGEQGSGKSLFQLMLKRVFDPSATELRRPPRDEGDLMIAARNERAPSFDNLSGMPEHLSDGFCCLSTGMVFAKRALYTNGEEVAYSARRPCIFNGIDTLTTKGDLLDRTIIVDLPKISEKDRKLEKKIMAEFNRIRPGILGLLLDATATGLRREAEIVTEDLPRMADFCTWVIACEPSLPWKEGEFMAAYKSARKNAYATLVEGDQVAGAVYAMALRNAQSGKNEFKGTMSELLDILTIALHTEYPPKGWPRTPNALSNRISRTAPALRSQGVEIERYIKENSKIISISIRSIRSPDGIVFQKPISGEA